MKSLILAISLPCGRTIITFRGLYVVHARPGVAGPL
jgi:hypothetical protein